MTESLDCPARSGNELCHFAAFCAFKSEQGKPSSRDMQELWAPITEEAVEDVATALASSALTKEFREGIAWPVDDDETHYCSLRRERSLHLLADLTTDETVRETALQLVHGEVSARAIQASLEQAMLQRPVA